MRINNIMTGFGAALVSILMLSGCNAHQSLYYTGPQYQDYVQNVNDANIELFDPSTGQSYRSYGSTMQGNIRPQAVNQNVDVYGLGAVRQPAPNYTQLAFAPKQAFNQQGQSLFRGGVSGTHKAQSDIVGSGHDVYFGHGQVKLDKADKAVVSRASSLYKANPLGALNVEGHASQRNHARDPVEKSILNLRTSLDRAFEVSSTLIRSGVPASAVTTIGYGDARPSAHHQGLSPEAANRRVEIHGSALTGTVSAVPAPVAQPYYAPQWQQPLAAPADVQVPQLRAPARAPMLLDAPAQPIPLYNN